MTIVANESCHSDCIQYTDGNGMPNLWAITLLTEPLTLFLIIYLFHFEPRISHCFHSLFQGSTNYSIKSLVSVCHSKFSVNPEFIPGLVKIIS